jgi:RNA polymerase sigma-70 factor (ECF subfamily)
MIAFSEQLLEQRLLGRLRKGDREAFEQLVREHGPRMMAVIRRFLNEHDSLDAMQDALLSAFRSIGRFHNAARLGTWLHRIAVNSALMRIRSQKRRDECSIEDLPLRTDRERIRAGLHSPLAKHQHERIDEETRELVRRCIGLLPEAHREVLMLRDIDEKSTAEAAAVLSISKANVKTRLHRARAALKELLVAHQVS